jgi:hypothetical protein
MRIPLTVVAFVSISTMLIAAEPFVGTSKLNLEKSTLLGNDRNLASETMTISNIGPNSFRTTIDSVPKSGQTRHVEINRLYDGKEHPRTGVGFKQEGATEIDQRVDAAKRRVTQKRDGKVVSEFTSTTSPDGKTLTNKVHRPDGSEEIEIFEKQ